MGILLPPSLVTASNCSIIMMISSWDQYYMCMSGVAWLWYLDSFECPALITTAVSEVSSRIPMLLRFVLVLSSPKPNP